MAMKRLDKSQWGAYFDAVSKHLDRQLVEIEVASLAIGDQIAAEWVRLQGITYDAHSDILQIVTPDIDHMVHKPAEIFVEESGKGLERLDVTDSDGAKQIIRLKEPLMITQKSS